MEQTKENDPASKTEQKRRRIVYALRRAVALGIDVPAGVAAYEGRLHYDACRRIVDREDDPAHASGQAEYNLVYRTADRALEWAKVRRHRSPTGEFAAEAEAVYRDLAAALGNTIL